MPEPYDVPIRDESIRLGQFLKLANLGESGAEAKPPSQEPSRPALSDEQKAQLQAQMEQYRACLAAQGLTLPQRPA